MCVYLRFGIFQVTNKGLSRSSGNVIDASQRASVVDDASHEAPFEGGVQNDIIGVCCAFYFKFWFFFQQ